MAESNQKEETIKLYTALLESFKLFGKCICYGIQTTITAIALTGICTGITNSQLRYSSSKTAVFTSGYDNNIKSPETVATICDVFMYAPVTLSQNFQGNHVEWYSNATKEEILKVLKEEDYKSIVFIGHGSQSTFTATNGNITSLDILGNNIPKKSGELVQHTCGEKDSIPTLREVLLENPKKSFHFNGKVSIPKNYFSAWGRLF